jgi:hypothetical protein
MVLHNHTVMGKIVPVGEKTKSSKYRTSENSCSDEFHRLVEDEASGIAETGKGYCFNDKQLEAIKISLKNKLSSKEYATLECRKEDGYFNISFKRTRKKYTKKQDLVLA